MTGPPFFTGQAGVPVGWRGPGLPYYTDPGDLSAYVTHTQADALVAAAAGVWNVPVASITVSQGGVLAEHVSGANVYLGSGGMVYPADVSSANYAARPIAVIYDTDGSVTDTLLGLGASGPASCRQNAVTESVDRFDPAGYILHAIIVLNGRCTAAASAAQLDMQYKLERVFGRVLGLAWSQLNDNVFTGTPQPTYYQALNWPVMHPVEIICGTYTYTCMPQPFTLRTDDIAALVGVYPILNAAAATAAGAGKAVSLAAAAFAYGTVNFPTGEGMAGVNLTAVRTAADGSQEGWQEASAVSGAMFRRNGTSALVGADTSAWGSMGGTSMSMQNAFNMAYLPFPAGQGFTNVVLETEPVNALYTGQYSVGPYATGAVLPSGSAVAARYTGLNPGTSAGGNYTIADAAGSCGTGLDGSAAQPPPVAASGWWQGLLCGYGYVSYAQLPVRPGRTFTVEVTALDAAGLSTTAKMMPVVGLWSGTEAAGTLPTQGVAATAFQGRGVGMTTLGGATGTLTEMRLGIADQRGDGRPDYTFQGRFFYADSVTPTQLPVAGGNLTVTGYGFKAGNAVYVNGVLAAAVSGTQTTLTVTAPTLVQAGVSAGTALDVEVLDLSTGAVSVMTGAVSYVPGAGLGKVMRLVSAQVADAPVGTVAPVPFAVQVLQADGVTPVAGDAVVFSVSAGAATYGACGAVSCTVVTDAHGMAQTAVTPGAVGEITMEATDGVVPAPAGVVAATAVMQTASFNGLARSAVLQVIQGPTGNQNVGAIAQPDMLVRLFATDGSALGGRTLTWTVTAGSAILSGCYAPVCATATQANGVASISITPLALGTVTLSVTDGVLVQMTTFQAVLSLDTMQVTAVPASPVNTGVSAGLFAVRLLQPNGYGDYYQPVVFSAPAGVVFDQCRANPCTVGTDSQGNAGASPTASAAGTYTVTATFGTGLAAIAKTASFTATVKTVTRLTITSVPANGSAEGVYAAQPFSVLLLNADGSPAAYANVTLSGPTSQVFMDCGRSNCLATTDANGVTGVRVIPLRAGPISLSAAAIPFTANATFNAVAASKSMSVVTQPANGAYVGAPGMLTVQVVQPDGVTPAAGDTVVFTVSAGSFTFSGCASPCSVVTDANGRASVGGTATAAGAVTVTATDGAVSQTMTFNAVSRLDTMQILQAPSGKNTAGGMLEVPFAVKVLLPDGVTPAAGRTVLFAVSVGYAGFGACAAANCTVTTDANGVAQTAVYTTGPGAVTLEAVDTGAGQSAFVTASFTAVGAGDTLRVLSQPGDGAVVYDFEQQPLTVQLVGPDGVTAVAGQSVTFATPVGNTGLTLCNGAPGCAALTDANGMVTTLVRPLSSGAVTMSATDGPLRQSVTFTVLRQPDTLTLVSGPANGAFVGGPAAVPFAVRALQADGTAAAGRQVTLAVVSGSATLLACGAGSCAVTADSSGLVSSAVTPLAPGTVGLQATDGNAQIGYSFTAVARPDTLAVVQSPANGGLAGQPAVPAFSVKVTGGYAGGALAGRTVVFTVADGTASLGCGSATCSVVTNSNGLASIAATPGAAGTVTLQAAEAGQQVQAQFTVAAPHALKLVSVPADGSYVGAVAAPAFAVQVVAADGTPVAGESVTVNVTKGQLSGAGTCAATCAGVSDASGMVGMAVTPLAAGLVGLTAVDGGASVSASFTAVVQPPPPPAAPPAPDVLSQVSAPAGQGVVGTVMPTALSVRLLAGDGTARVGIAVVFSVGAGGAKFGACAGTVSCSVVTDAAGVASTTVTPAAAGMVTVLAVSEGMSVSASFMAVAPVPPPPQPPPSPPLAPDVLSLVSAPAGQGTVGTVMPTAFSVRLLAGDGTARVGVAVVFSVGAGGARFGPCAGAGSCSVVTDATGLASTTVTPTGAGAVTVQAASEGMSVSASFTAISPPDGLTVAQAPGASVYVGDSTSFAVRVTLADGVTPAAGVRVTFSADAAGPGQVSFDACGTAAVCVVGTDAHGLASTGVTGMQPGVATLMASADATSGAGSVRVPLAVLANVDGLTGLPASLYVAEGAAFRDNLSVTATRNGAPAAGTTVTWTATGGLSLGSMASVTDAGGVARVAALLGPLAGGAGGTVEACAWSGTCSELTVTGVALADLQITVSSGGTQTVPAGQVPAALVALVTDGAGHPIAGAAVTVFQTMYAAVSCPARGRCPAAAILGTRASALTSGEDGSVSVGVLTGAAAGPGTETKLEFTVGTAGVAVGDVVVGGR